MRYLLVFLLLVGVAGCASVQSYSTGIRATGADKFFFHVEQEALSLGFGVYESVEQQRLTVNVRGGSIRYEVVADEILLYTSLNKTDIPEAEAARRHRILKEISDDLIAGARIRAEESNPFE